MKKYEMEYQVSVKGNFKRSFTRDIIAKDYKEALEKGKLMLNVSKYNNLDVDYIKFTEKGNIISDYTVLMRIKEIISLMKYSDNPRVYHLLKTLETSLNFKVTNGLSEIYDVFDVENMIQELYIIYFTMINGLSYKFEVRDKLESLIRDLKVECLNQIY